MYPYKKVWKDGEYQKLIDDNIREHRRILTELGLIGPDRDPCTLRATYKKPRKPRQRRVVNIVYDENSLIGRVKLQKRSSKPIVKLDYSTYFAGGIGRKREVRKNIFGAISDVPVGKVFESRLECSYAGVHRPTVAGIHGNEQEGCYSLALSGGYEDDVDTGVSFTYTGQGGRNLKGTTAKPKNLRTAPQTKDQTLSLGNLALTINIENGKPVRVIRGYKLKSPFAPEKGYRYDGLYTVKKFWKAKGLSGHMVYKYALKRCENQEAPPWEKNEVKAEEQTTENMRN